MSKHNNEQQPLIYLAVFSHQPSSRRLLQASNTYLITITGLAVPIDTAAATDALTAIANSVLKTIQTAFPGSSLVKGTVFLPAVTSPSPSPTPTETLGRT